MRQRLIPCQAGAAPTTKKPKVAGRLVAAALPQKATPSGGAVSKAASLARPVKAGDRQSSSPVPVARVEADAGRLGVVAVRTLELHDIFSAVCPSFVRSSHWYRSCAPGTVPTCVIQETAKHLLRPSVMRQRNILLRVRRSYSLGLNKHWRTLGHLDQFRCVSHRCLIATNTGGAACTLLPRPPARFALLASPAAVLLAPAAFRCRYVSRRRLTAHWHSPMALGLPIGIQ